MKTLAQPYPVLADLSDSSLVLSVLSSRTPSSAKDASSAGDDMIVVGAPNPLAGGGYDFGGAADYLKRSEANWRSADSEGTIEAWIKLDNLGTFSTIFSSGDEASGNNYFTIRMDSTTNKVRIITNTGITHQVEGSTALVAGPLYHIVVRSSGTAWLMEINGSTETISIITGSNTGNWFADISGRDNITIGTLNRSTVSNYFDGEIRQVNVYSENKSTSWSSERFHKGVPDPSLVLNVDDGTKDKSRYRHDVINSGVVVGNRMKYDGSSYINIDDVISDIASDTVGTLMSWVNPDDATPVSTNDFILSISDQSANEFIGLQLTPAGKFQAICADGGSFQWIVLTDDVVFIDGTWKHLGVSQNGTEPVLTVNGVAVDQTFSISTDKTKWFNDLSGIDKATIGAIDYNNGGYDFYWAGKQDDVKVLNQFKSVAWLKQYVQMTRVRY